MAQHQPRSRSSGLVNQKLPMVPPTELDGEVLLGHTLRDSDLAMAVAFARSGSGPYMSCPPDMMIRATQRGAGRSPLRLPRTLPCGPCSVPPYMVAFLGRPLHEVVRRLA
jgi:hypothetical protein